MTGYIYVVENEDGLYKIGFASDPLKRMASLRTSVVGELRLLGVVPGTPEQEKELHKLLAPWRVMREWFRPCIAILPLINGLRAPPVAQQKYAREVKLSGAIGDLCREKHGFRVHLARSLGVTHGAIYQWRRVPAERVLDVERISGISRSELRPDLYPAAEATQ